MNLFPEFNTIIAGRIFFETIINKEKRVFINQPGGNVLYAAAGFSLWKKKAGLAAKINEIYPTEWKKDFEKANLDLTGIIKINGEFEQRRFYRIIDSDSIQIDNP